MVNTFHLMILPSGQPGSRQCSVVLLSGQMRAVAGGSGSKRFSRDTSESGCCGSGQAELDEEGLKNNQTFQYSIKRGPRIQQFIIRPV